MIAALEQFPQLTPAEYLEWEERQAFKYEYVDGKIRSMTGGTLNHSQISGNFYYILQTHLRGKGYRVLTSDAKVQIAAASSYVYPDISVTGDDRDKAATKFIDHPCLIVEVLSPSTEAYDSPVETLCDRWGKFNLYQRSDALQDYVLVNTDQMEIALYSKNDRNKWEIIRYVAGDQVELTSVNLTFPIEQVFEEITFTPVVEN